MEFLDVIKQTENGVQINEEFIKNYLYACQMVEEFEKAKKNFTEKLVQAMGENHILTFESDSVKITYMPESKKETFDSKNFKLDHKDLYDSYTKLSDVKAYVRVTKK